MFKHIEFGLSLKQARAISNVDSHVGFYPAPFLKISKVFGKSKA